MNKSSGVTWEKWLEELVRVATCANYGDISDTNWEVFRPNYDEDMTPAEAMLEDLSYA